MHFGLQPAEFARGCEANLIINKNKCFLSGSLCIFIEKVYNIYRVSILKKIKYYNKKNIYIK